MSLTQYRFPAAGTLASFAAPYAADFTRSAARVVGRRVRDYANRQLHRSEFHEKASEMRRAAVRSRRAPPARHVYGAGRDLIGHTDHTTLYRGRRKTRKGKSKARFTGKVKRAVLTGLGKKQIVFEWKKMMTTAEQAQTNNSYQLYSAAGRAGDTDNANLQTPCMDVQEMLDNMSGARSWNSTTQTGDDMYAGGITDKDVNLHFTSAVLELTYVNGGTNPVILDVYDWFCYKDVPKDIAASIDDLYLRGFNKSGIVKNLEAPPATVVNTIENTGGFDFRPSPWNNSSTPWMSQDFCKHLKITQKKRYVLQPGKDLHLIRKDYKQRTMNNAKVQFRTAMAGHTQGLFVQAFGVPGLTPGASPTLVSALPINVVVSEFRYYNFRYQPGQKNEIAGENIRTLRG